MNAPTLVHSYCEVCGEDRDMDLVDSGGMLVYRCMSCHAEWEFGLVSFVEI